MDPSQPVPDMKELRQEVAEKLQELMDVLKEKTGSFNNILVPDKGETVTNQTSGFQDNTDMDPNEVARFSEAMFLLNQVVDNLGNFLRNHGEQQTPRHPYEPNASHKQMFEKYKEMACDKMEQERQMIKEESANAVKSLVDMAISYSEASNVNKGIVCDKLKQQCNILFEKGLPVTSFVDGLEDLLDAEFVVHVSPEDLKLEVQRQYTLNEIQLQEYLSSRVSGEILGHIVHRLLGVKYPRPPPPPGSDLPWLPAMALLLNFEDSEAMGNLHEVLAGQDVQLVLFEYALEYCIEAYRKEGPGLPLLESREPPPCTENPEIVTPMDRLLPHALLGNRKLGPTEVPSHKEKETQTGPDVIPTLSLAASLGKQALEILRLNENLSDWLMVAILIEYLKQISTCGISGWVLADFPSTFLQVSLFETAISGQRVPNPDLKPEEENLSTLTLHQSSIVCDPSEPVKALEPFKTVFTSVVSVLDTDPPSEPHLLDFVPLVEELYLRQRVHYCLHCKTWNEENIIALAALLLEISPSTSNSTPTEKVSTKYEFVDFPVHNDLALGLASLWESLETTYLSSLHRVFLTNRSHEQRVAKYIVTVRGQFSEFLSRPDTMQEMATTFQQSYQEVPRVMLDDPEVQDELNTRVVNLRQSLCDIAEFRRNESELELSRIAGESWLSRELGALLNITSAKVQLELDRFVDTTALLQDYFFASLDKIPPDASKSLRFDVPKALGSDVTDDWAATLASMLVAPEQDSSDLPETFLKHLDLILQGATSHLEKLNNTISTSISKFETEIKPKPAASKKKQVVEKTKNKKKGANTSNIQPLEDEEALRLISLKLQMMGEWRAACKSEAEVIALKLEEMGHLLRSQAQELINKISTEFFMVATTAFNAQFKSDCHSAASLCEFLEFALAARSTLTSPLKFPRNTSYLQYLKNPYGDNDVMPVTTDYTVAAKLTSLIDMLQRVAPEGILFKSAFLVILQQAANSKQCCYLPASWQGMSLEDVASLLDKSSSTNCVNWRAFVLRILELPVPSQRQLLLAKHRYEQNDTNGRGKINKSNFLKTRLWLDEAFEHDEDAVQTKEAIFTIFSSQSRELTNYRDFLLASCSDTNPVLGFSKACSVLSGHVINTSFEVKSKYQEMMDAMLLEMNISFPETTMIHVDTASAVLNIGQPSQVGSVSSLSETLQEVFKEVEDQSLTDEQRRARHRQAVLTPQDVSEEPVTSVIASFLVKNPIIVELASPAYQTESFSALIQKSKMAVDV